MKVTRVLKGIAVFTGLIAVLTPLSALGQRRGPAPMSSDASANAAATGNGNRKGGGKPTGAAAWQDDFNGIALDRSRWVNASGQAPGYIPGNHLGYYDPTHVRVLDGYLVISLTQENGAVDSLPGVISRGGLIYTKNRYGYGTYEWRMRMSSTATDFDQPGLAVSGSISAGFNYVNKSQTEIDFEFAGHNPTWLYMSNWRNTNPRTDPTERQETLSSAHLPDMTSTFQTYKFVWEPGKITFYIDHVPQTNHVTDIPSAPANFMINHWGTNDPDWGGTQTIGTTRYFYVDWAKFTPVP